MAEYQEVTSTPVSPQASGQAPAATHTTIITEPRSRSSGSTLLVVIALVLLAIVGLWVFSGMSGSEMAKDNAVAEAADKVGAAAGQVGDAAQDVAQDVTGNSN